ncbi:hypothetical protein J6590_064579 [Homalodisca vitripennis]|nr:hypothetical protein J6590_064579 [Homalodisca vitripennis]
MLKERLVNSSFVGRFVFVSDQDEHVIILRDTSMRFTVPFLPNRSAFQKRQGNAGGGTAEGRCELAAAIFQFRQFPLLVVTAYKPKPFSASVQEHEMFYECLSDCLHNITNPAVRTVVVGDFNVNLSVPDIKVDKLLSMMASHDLSNKVTSFTREFKNSRSLIDHVYTDLSKDIFSCSVMINALFDHHAQISHVRCLSSPGCPKFMLKRSFVEENLRIFRHLLSGETWHDVCAARTKDDKMSLFMSSIEFYFIQALPEKRVWIRGRSPNAKVSLTQEQIELRDLVVHCYYKTKDLSSSDERRKHYLSLKRQFRASVREAKSSKVKHLLQTSSNKVKTVWDIDIDIDILYCH